MRRNKSINSQIKQKIQNERVVKIVKRYNNNFVFHDNQKNLNISSLFIENNNDLVEKRSLTNTKRIIFKSYFIIFDIRKKF